MVHFEGACPARRPVLMRSRFFARLWIARPVELCTLWDARPGRGLFFALLKLHDQIYHILLRQRFAPRISLKPHGG